MSFGDISGYYALFGVSPQAHTSEISASYRSLLRSWHPDIAVLRGVSAQEAHEKSAEITRAYAVLSNPRSRAKYDAASDKVRAPRPPAQRSKAAPAPPGELPGLKNVILAALGYPELNPVEVESYLKYARAAHLREPVGGIYASIVAAHNGFILKAEDIFKNAPTSQEIQEHLAAARRLRTPLPEEVRIFLRSPRDLLMEVAKRALESLELSSDQQFETKNEGSSASKSSSHLPEGTSDGKLTPPERSNLYAPPRFDPPSFILNL